MMPFEAVYRNRSRLDGEEHTDDVIVLESCEGLNFIIARSDGAIQLVSSYELTFKRHVPLDVQVAR